MPKMKRHKGAVKRMKVTASGKVKRTRAYKAHKLEVKSAKRRRSLRQDGMVSSADRKRVSKLLPYR